MCLQITPDLDSSTTMFLAAAGFSVEPETIEDKPEIIEDCKASIIFYEESIESIISMCNIRLKEQLIHLLKEMERAYFVFSISSAVKGGIYINIGSHRICAPYNLRVNHPLLQMVLFAENLHGDSFGCLKSMAPKWIASMAETSDSSASPTEYIADWISADWKPESPNAVGNPPCGNKKPLLPVLFNMSAIEKTSSTVSVIPQSGDNVKSGPYDSSMTVAEGNCGVSNKSNKELGKAGSSLSFREVSNDCQQHVALTGGSHDARLQMPMAQQVACVDSICAASSVKCGDTDESSMLTKQTSPQEQFILNSSGDGGNGNQHFSSALRTTPFTETTFAPVAPVLIEVDPQHSREIDLASEVDILEAIHMMNGFQGTNADGQMHDVFILDSGSPEHCTGDISQFSDYQTEVRPDRYMKGAGGKLMRVHGTGTIHNENFQVNGVLYVPGLNNEPNINKTIFSVAKLNELGYGILFNSDGTVSVIDTSKRTWNLKHEIVGVARKNHGHFMPDYLRIPINRDPVPMLEGPGFLKSLRKASLSVWSSITGRLSQRTTCTRRPPV